MLGPLRAVSRRRPFVGGPISRPYFIFNDSLTLTQAISLSHTFNFNNSIILTQTIGLSFSGIFDSIDFLTLTQTVTPSLTYNFNPDDFLILTQSIIESLSHANLLIRQNLFLYQTIDVRLSTSTIVAGWASQCIPMLLDLQQEITYTKSFVSQFSFLDLLFLRQSCISFDLDRGSVDRIQCQVESVLDLNQKINIGFTVPGASVFNKSLISHLSLNQNVTVTKGILTYKSINQNLIFAQTIAHTSGNIINRLIVQPITFNDTLLYSKGLVYSQSVSSALSFIQHLTISTPNVTQESVINTLNLTQDIGHSFEQIILKSISHTLSPTQSIARHLVYHRTVSSPLTLTQTITKQKVVFKSIANPLTLTDSIVLAANYNRSIVQRLEFLEPYYQIALSYNNIIDVPVVIIIKTKYRNFSVNYQSSGSVITLPSPDWEDTESLDNALVIKRTMTGGVFTYVKQVPIRILQYKFSLGRLKVFELEKFLIDTNAQPVMMHNWKDELWAGYITNNPIDITENREYDNEISIQFQGVRIG